MIGRSTPDGWGRDRRAIRLSLIAAAVSICLAPVAQLHALPPPSRSIRVSPVRSFAGFSGLFTLARGAVRIIALVAPESDNAPRDVDAVRRLFAAIPDRHFRGYVIFAPNHKTHRSVQLLALELVHPGDDPRIQFFWDPNRFVAASFDTLLSREASSESLYLLYGPETAFGASPAHPNHLSRPADRDTLDTRRFVEHARTLLDAYKRARRAERDSSPHP